MQQDDDEESSDFSVDENSSMLDVMQKLRKIDPETLILNFSQLSRNDVDAQSGSSNKSEKTNEDIEVNEVSDDESYATGGILKGNKKQVFAFAAYIPPGKHLMIVRDVGTDLKRLPESDINNL